MTQLTPWVREYSLRELLDDPYDLFKACAPTLLLAGAIPYIFVVIYLAVMRLTIIKGTLLREFSKTAFNEMVGSWEFWVFIIGLLVVWNVAVGLGYLAQCRIAVQCALGAPVTVREAYRKLVVPLLALLFIYLVSSLWASVVTGAVSTVLSILVAILIGVSAVIQSEVGMAIGGSVGVTLLVLLVEAAVMFAYTFFLAAPCMLVMESSNPMSAMARSFRMGMANLKAHFTALYAVTRLPIVVSMVVVLIGVGLIAATDYVSPTMSLVLETLLFGLSAVIIVALMAATQALVYLDGRCRLEAYDLHVMASSLGLGDMLQRATAPQPTAAPAVRSRAARAVAMNVPPPQRSVVGAVPRILVPGLTPPPTAPGYPDYSAPPPGGAAIFAVDAEPPAREEADDVPAQGAAPAGEDHHRDVALSMHDIPPRDDDQQPVTHG